jgi:uncharacterized iron-regulated membrane protein
MLLRKVLSKIHLWFSLLAGIFIVLICLTGSILVFEGELNRAFYPELFKVTQGKAVSYDTAYQAVMEKYSKGKVDRIYTADYPDTEGVYVYRVKVGKERKQVYVDPGTGKITGELGNHTITGWIANLHYYLLLQDFSGREIVSSIGVVLFFVTASGLYLWWPGIKNWVRGFTIRKGSNLFASYYDYHKLLGIISVPLLLVVSITGALFTFDDTIFGWFGAVSSVSPAKQVLVSKPLPAGKTSIDKVIGIAQETVADAKVTQIRIPAQPEKGKPEGAVEVRLSRSFDPGELGNVKVWMDQYSGKIVAQQDATVDSGLTYQTWLYPLHTGKFGGIVTKILYCIGGLLPAVLMVTGTYMWYYKARKKKLGKQNRNKAKEFQTAV